MNKLEVMFVLGLSLLLSGCIQTGSETKYVCADGNTVVTDIKSCPPPATATTQPSTPEERELEVCSGMPSTQTYLFEDYCIIGVAGKYKNMSLCKRAARDQRMLCYTIVAELKNDPDTCLGAEAQTDQCFEQYARDKKDGSICDRITDVRYKSNCYNSLANQLSDQELCDKITDVNSKDNCYNNLANQLSNPSLCDKIKNTNQKDNCYSNIAMRLGDSSYCNRITNANQQQSCLQNIQSQGRPIEVVVPKPI